MELREAIKRFRALLLPHLVRKQERREFVENRYGLVGRFVVRLVQPSSARARVGLCARSVLRCAA
jgi:hypothetical protein